MPLHRQSQEFLSALAALDRPGWDAMPPEESRAVFASLTDAFGSGPDLPVVEDGRAKAIVIMGELWGERAATTTH